MRTRHALVGIVAATLGFGAVAMGATGANWAWVALLLGCAGLLAVMVGRAIVTPRILLVGDADGGQGMRRPGALEQALEDAGFGICTCAGPTYRHCPVLAGGTCPVQVGASAVVVFHPAGYAGPVPPCGLALGLPELTIEEASLLPPRIVGQQGQIGSERGVTEAVRTLTALIGTPANSVAAQISAGG